MSKAGAGTQESGDNSELVQRRNPAAVMSQAWEQRSASWHGEWRCRHRHGGGDADAGVVAEMQARARRWRCRRGCSGVVK